MGARAKVHLGERAAGFCQRLDLLIEERRTEHMFRFLIRRFIGLLFVVLGVTFITFILGYLSPSDPIKEMLGDHYIYATWARLRHEYGLDLPWYQQYFQYLINLMHGNLGIAFHPQQRAVWD